MDVEDEVREARGQLRPVLGRDRVPHRGFVNCTRGPSASITLTYVQSAHTLGGQGIDATDGSQALPELACMRSGVSASMPDARSGTHESQAG